jgi:CheY-like chemotaxis protein
MTPESVFTTDLLSEPFTSEAPAKGRILVAEDNPANQLVALYLLKSLGYESEVVATGEGAIHALSGRDYDLVLMDCQMPVMDGFTATRAIREAEKTLGGRIPIIAMTAYALKGDREKCIEAGMDDYISKPVTLQVLEDIIGALLDPDSKNASEPAGGSPGESGGTIDPGAMKELLNLQEEGASNIVEELIAIFLEDAPKRMASLRGAMDSADPSTLAHNAHALKGSCAVIGAVNMRDLCYELEKLGRPPGSKTPKRSSAASSGNSTGSARNSPKSPGRNSPL